MKFKTPSEISSFADAKEYLQERAFPKVNDNGIHPDWIDKHVSLIDANIVLEILERKLKSGKISLES